MENKNKTYIQRKVEHYDKTCLTPLFGNEKVKESLLEGLVKTLEETSSRLDFDEIDRYTGNIRVGNALRTMNIQTYEELSDLDLNNFYREMRLKGHHGTFGVKSLEKLRAYVKEMLTKEKQNLLK